MRWIVGYKLKLCLVIIYIGYWSVVNSLLWNVESTLELDYERTSTPMGPNGSHSEFIYHVKRFMRVGLTLGSLLCMNVFWSLHKIAYEIVNKV